MPDLQAKGPFDGDGGNRTRASIPPSIAAVNPAGAGETREQWLYRFHDKHGALLYIGVTQCGEERWTEHRLCKPWWPQVDYATIQTYASRDEVLLAERNAIYREKPRYNVAHNSTGRRLYGSEPIPLSEPLTREAADRAAICRLADAWGDTKAPVLSLSEWRRSRRRVSA